MLNVLLLLVFSNYDLSIKSQIFIKYCDKKSNFKSSNSVTNPHSSISFKVFTFNCEVVNALRRKKSPDEAKFSHFGSLVLIREQLSIEHTSMAPFKPFLRSSFRDVLRRGAAES